MHSLLNFPLKRFKIINQSMEPVISNGTQVLVISYFFANPKVGDVIIFEKNLQPYIFCKRIEKINKDKIWVVGENKNSIDSRNFGFIDKKNIIGKVIFKL